MLDLDHLVRARTPVTCSMAADQPSRLIGVDYPVDRVADLLTEVGCDGAPRDGDRARRSPRRRWRPDLREPADLVEEVVRLDGFDNVPSVLPIAPPGNGLTPAQRRRRTVGRALAEQGYVEVLSLPVRRRRAADALGLPADARAHAVRLANPLSEEEPLLRTSLLPPLLGTLQAQPRPRPARRGAVRAGPGLPARARRRPRRRRWAWTAARPTRSWQQANAVVPAQPWHVAAVLAGEFEPSGWWGAGRAAELGGRGPGRPRSCWPPRASRPPGHGTRRPSTPRGTRAGARRSRSTAPSSGTPASCTRPLRGAGPAEAHLRHGAGPGRGAGRAGGARRRSLSTFPPALIDVALVVRAAVPAARGRGGPASRGRAAAGVGAAVRRVRVEQLGAGRKSLAYKLTFRAPDRTLTVEEAVAARDAAVAAAARPVRRGAARRLTAMRRPSRGAPHTTRADGPCAARRRGPSA